MVLLLPCLYNPRKLAERALGVSPPLEALLSERENLEAARSILVEVARHARLELPDDTYRAVLSFHAAIALAALSRSPRLLRLLAEAAAIRATRILRAADRGDVEAVARALGIPLGRAKISIPWLLASTGSVLRLSLPYSVPVADYLVAARGAESPELQLPNAFLMGGKVFLDVSRLLQLVAHRIRLRIYELAETYSSVESRLLKEEALKVAAELEAKGSIDEEALPPCIRQIIERGVDSDEEAYMLVSFLMSVRPPPSMLEEVLLKSGAAGPRSAGNIAAAILSLEKRYTPYRCDTDEARRACRDACRRGVLAEYWEAMSGARRRVRGSRGSS